MTTENKGFPIKDYEEINIYEFLKFLNEKQPKGNYLYIDKDDTIRYKFLIVRDNRSITLLDFYTMDDLNVFTSGKLADDDLIYREYLMERDINYDSYRCFKDFVKDRYMRLYSNYYNN